ncbi:NAD(P)-dependent oxidoreductase [Thermogymnomonas acidicola]|uniref:NAD(P)-dependent oxidoreductase n=1 Tax=Thermogymnomonas acidicola TaxID=399579 RepID=A0AA37FBN1_9ARCH|nr:dTDP-4-dehydrorhamnose reductase [Thermogymnomonas acidicola]GGM76817.1 NAD(P)-dependent oxidoreductase [Thermogymnomonas acidicola]
MKTLIIGSDGQLGSQLMEFMPNPTGASRKGKDSMRLDISDVHEVENLILSEKPDVVVNAAAITDVDLCEREREMALKVNGIAVRSMARACSVIGSYFIHISTDYVFDGEKGMYKEDDAPNPLNYYGISKLYGEASALAYDETLVVRTSGVFGYKQNFPLFVLKTLQGNGTVKCIDSFYSPIHARLLARAIAELLGRRPYGIINVSGARISRYELAMKIKEFFGIDTGTVVQQQGQSGIVSARRPHDSSLDNSRARALLSFDFESVESNLRTMREELGRETMEG